MRFKLFILLVSSIVATAKAETPQAVGWRTDGTGLYPQAEPPATWAADKNVIWATPMPGWSNATPILVGDKIFVCCEPTTLLCVSAADGKVLWQKTNSYMEMLSDEEAAQARQDRKKAEEIIKKLNPLKKQLDELIKKLRKTPKDDELRAKAKAVKKQVKDVEQQLKLVSKWRLPSTNNVNGYSTCTPTSDGKNVYVLFGTGVAACYDLEGNRKWIRLVEKPKAGDGHSASPLLVGDKLLVHVLNLLALEKDTGKEVWRAKSQPRWGSPVRAKIGEVDVAITPSGDLIRVMDGKVLARQLGRLEYCAPVVHGGAVYFIEHGGKAVKLPTEPAEKVEIQALWQTKPKKDRYYASPVYHEGLIYAVTQQGVFSAIDAKTGEVVYEQKLELGKGTVYTSVTAAGKHILVSSDNGTTIVVQPGREYKEITKNTLEAFRTCPVFSGTRMYIRGQKSLYCVGK